MTDIYEKPDPFQFKTNSGDADRRDRMGIKDSNVP